MKRETQYEQNISKYSETLNFVFSILVFIYHVINLLGIIIIATKWDEIENHIVTYLTMTNIYSLIFFLLIGLLELSIRYKFVKSFNCDFIYRFSCFVMYIIRPILSTFNILYVVYPKILYYVCLVYFVSDIITLSTLIIAVYKTIGIIQKNSNKTK